MTALFLSQIRLDGGTQPRAEINQFLVLEYADAIRNGDQFPAVTVYFDGTDYWLADGFHRFHATQAAEKNLITADVRQGTREDAQWFSFGANAHHGLRRSNEDKRRSVEAALLHISGAGRSNRDIARHCGVSESTVREARERLESSARIAQIEDRKVTRNGTTYVLDTANIGERPDPTPEPFIQSTIQTSIATDEATPEPTAEELQYRLAKAEALLAEADRFLLEDAEPGSRAWDTSTKISHYFDDDEADDQDDESDNDDEDPAPIIPILSPSLPPTEVITPQPSAITSQPVASLFDQAMRHVDVSGLEVPIDHAGDVRRWLRQTIHTAKDRCDVSFTDEHFQAFVSEADQWDLELLKDVETLIQRIQGMLQQPGKGLRLVR